MKQETFQDILDNKKAPAIAIDADGLITYVNQLFTKSYGWNDDDLIGQVITVIMPAHMRDAHNFGFSRFLISEESRILNKRLSLPIQCKNGQVLEAEHFIVGEKSEGTWRFAATIISKTRKT